MFFESYNLNKNVEECWADLANGLPHLPVSTDYLSPGHRLLPAVCSFPVPRSGELRLQIEYLLANYVDYFYQ